MIVGRKAQGCAHEKTSRGGTCFHCAVHREDYASQAAGGEDFSGFIRAVCGEEGQQHVDVGQRIRRRIAGEAVDMVARLSIGKALSVVEHDVIADGSLSDLLRQRINVRPEAVGDRLRVHLALARRAQQRALVAAGKLGLHLKRPHEDVLAILVIPRLNLPGLGVQARGHGRKARRGEGQHAAVASIHGHGEGAAVVVDAAHRHLKTGGGWIVFVCGYRLDADRVFLKGEDARIAVGLKAGAGDLYCIVLRQRAGALGDGRERGLRGHGRAVFDDRIGDDRISVGRVCVCGERGDGGDGGAGAHGAHGEDGQRHDHQHRHHGGEDRLEAAARPARSHAGRAFLLAHGAQNAAHVVGVKADGAEALVDGVFYLIVFLHRVQPLSSSFLSRFSACCSRLVAVGGEMSRICAQVRRLMS